MFISQQQFNDACNNLQQSWQQLDLDDSPWREVKVLKSFTNTFLRIVKRVHGSGECARKKSVSHNYQNVEDEAIEEEDDEILNEPVQNPDEDLSIIYDVIHSPSYQVPVLYITLQPESLSAHAAKSNPKLVQTTPEDLYDLLIPTLHRAQVQAIGIIGALSMTDHPVSGVPAYFIHPCQTAEAMSAVLPDQRQRLVRPEQYLLAWLGLVGGSVGLNVPVELAEQMIGITDSFSTKIRLEDNATGITRLAAKPLEEIPIGRSRD